MGTRQAYTYGDEDWGDLLTAYDGVTISYDEIGNPLSDGTWTYTWEHGRELSTMTDGTTTWTYTYNADGMRTQRTNGTNTYKYIYNGSSLVQMTVGNDTLYFAYAGGTPTSVTYNDEVYYYVTNLQGDVIALLDGEGAVVVEYSYDAWGNILSTSGTMADTLGTINPLRYRSYVYDTETGLYYLQSRYYDPELGRFLNADAFASTGQGILGNNMFAYCGNNPVNCVDPTGTYYRTPHWRIAYLFWEGIGGGISPKSIGLVEIAAKVVEEGAQSAAVQTIRTHAPILLPIIATYYGAEVFLDYAWDGCDLNCAAGLAAVKTAKLFLPELDTSNDLIDVVGNTVIGVSLDQIEDNLETQGFADNAEVSQNQVYFRSVYAGAMTVGGSMKYIMLDN